MRPRGSNYLNGSDPFKHNCRNTLMTTVKEPIGKAYVWFSYCASGPRRFGSFPKCLITGNLG